MTLFDDLAADFAEIATDIGVTVKVFFGGAEPGIEHTIVINDRHLEGTREADGDGIADFNRPGGRKLRESITAFIAGTAPMTESPNISTQDRVDYDGYTWTVKRILGKYEGRVTKFVMVRAITSEGRSISQTG